MVLELAGLSLGVLGAAAGTAQRLPRGSARERHAAQRDCSRSRQSAAVALGNLDLSIDALRDIPSSTRLSGLLGDLSRRRASAAADYCGPSGAAVRRDGRALARFDVIPVVRSCVTLERPLALVAWHSLKWHRRWTRSTCMATPEPISGDHQPHSDAVDARSRTKGSSRSRWSVQETMCGAIKDHGVGIAPGFGRIFDPGFTKPPGRDRASASQSSEIRGTCLVERSTCSRPGGNSTFLSFPPIPPQRR
jgi:hypothetical protein